MKRFLNAVIVFFLVGNIGAQTRDSGSVVNDFQFVLHLASQKMFGEAESELRKLRSRTSQEAGYSDSASFYLGRQYEQAGMLPEARRLFLEVSDNTSLYYPARYRAMLIASPQNPETAFREARGLSPSTSETLNELRRFEIAGHALLIKQLNIFDSLSQETFKSDLLRDELNSLSACRTALERNKMKSPFIAGTLSAVIPGLGKVYAGNNGQALASFLTCALMGGITFENYRNMGPFHPQTLFFGALFGAFYIGNIWGSAVSVQLVKTEKDLETKHNILVALRVPVDTFFN